MNEISAIAPSTIVRFLRGVPLESTYENTVWWAATATRATQAEAFAGYTKPSTPDIDGTVYNFYIDKQSYQRYGRNQIRVQIPMDLLLDCNYLMFNNARYGSKWFYAFITHLEYVNEVTTTVSYEIDVLQTWYFDYEPNACYIERAHSYSDKIGENLLEENFELGEYMFKQDPVTDSTLATVGYYILAPWSAEIIYGEQGERTINFTKRDSGVYISGIYSGIWINRYSDLEDMKAVIDAASTQEGDWAQAIVAIYCAPYYAGTYNDGDPAESSLTVFNDITVFGRGYTPHNKKLYTYPYRGIQAFTGNGDSHTYMYEYFENARSAVSTGGRPASWSCNFKVIYDATPSGTCYLVPIGYKTWVTATKGQENWYESMSMGSYPNMAWTTNAYTQYLAQDGVVQALGNIAYGGDMNAYRGMATGLSVAGKALGSVVGGAATMIGGNVVGGAVNVLSGVVGSMVENVKAQNMPNNTQGATSSGQLKMKLNRMQFQLSPFTIRQEYAERIDAFWDWFGYPQKDITRPQRHARKHWTYVKTRGCTINGKIPADDERRICQLYDNGIRWWTTMSEIGDFYNLAADNTPLGEY